MMRAREKNEAGKRTYGGGAIFNTMVREGLPEKATPEQRLGEQYKEGERLETGSHLNNSSQEFCWVKWNGGKSATKREFKNKIFF